MDARLGDSGTVAGMDGPGPDTDFFPGTGMETVADCTGVGAAKPWS